MSEATASAHYIDGTSDLSDTSNSLRDWFSSELLTVGLSDDGVLTISVSIAAFAILLAVSGMVYLIFRKKIGFLSRVSDFEIDEAAIGVGSHRLKLRPNDVDRQIAYAIWVELSTRKLGLPIDPDNDIVEDVYSSWYRFFGIARDLIKSVPISKVRRSDTLKIVELSLLVLNDSLRPHLTKWQGRYRHWLGSAKEEDTDLSPQELQKSFPNYDEMMDDLLKVNRNIQAYRETMYELAVRS